MTRVLSSGLFLLTLLTILNPTKSAEQKVPAEEYLSWTSEQAVTIGKAWRVNGRVGGVLDLRVIHTEHSYNYKLRATLMTPEAIRATARLEQLRLHLNEDETRMLVQEAENSDQLIALVELDAREGSGVIPLEWRVSLRPKGAKPDSPLAIGGLKTPKLREVKALAGVARRDYAYDIFWIAFPLTNKTGDRVWETIPDSIELLVGIHNKQGTVTWPVSTALRDRINRLQPIKDSGGPKS